MKEENNNVLRDLNDSQKALLTLEQGRKDDRLLLDTLRTELSDKDSALIKESYAVMKTLFELINQTRGALAQLFCKLEDAASIRRKEYDHVLHERDILGSSLIRRNDELALMYEKLRSSRAHNAGYNARLDDMRILKIKVRDLQRQLAISQGGQAGTDDL
ncbi:hypothetical protein ACHAW5_011351 [Stephanodiscus triporus]|uniref:Cilia- and flagella-associated protein 58 central coiled coil domain-containing protein n=1 Tax=Stephanodiscus triporus TaxID=2934178 RepID=A0ABD3QST2_9STRA